MIPIATTEIRIDRNVVKPLTTFTDDTISLQMDLFLYSAMLYLNTSFSECVTRGTRSCVGSRLKTFCIDSLIVLIHF